MHFDLNMAKVKMIVAQELQNVAQELQSNLQIHLSLAPKL